MTPQAGILFVTMAPKPSLPPAQFHDWYNNEHGPARLRYSFFQNGFRYRASDLEGAGAGLPEWMAIYDVTDMAEMTKEPYTALRLPPFQSQRERDTMQQINVDRKFFDLVDSREEPEFRRLEDVEAEGERNVLVTVSFTLQPGKSAEELNKWYNEEHIPLMMKVPGWLRTRRFVTPAFENKEVLEYLSLHDFAPKNGLETTEEYKAMINTSWRDRIMKDVVKDKRRRVYNLAYTFGPAPRDLSTLTVDYTSGDGQTRTYPSPEPCRGAIESYINTADGAALPFRLEGSTDPSAPLIVLSNSILVDYSIWDSFIACFFSKSENRKYRIVRYLPRGRTSTCGSQPITIDVLATDIITILDAFRVKKAAAVIGVSLGGATVLNVGLKYPNRVQGVISCDTNSSSPAGNRKAWSERIALSEKENAIAASGETIVGQELAEITTRRWFVPQSYDGGELEKTLVKIKEDVASHSLEGFKKSVNALFEYDMRPLMRESKTKTTFLVGEKDGVLPATMKEMVAAMGQNGAGYVVIEGAGHLPMVEKPQEFAQAVTDFLVSP
jgi:pimeloyl-ACP methyl ester carboxylesterase